MWCLPGTHPQGLPPPAPTLEHPQISKNVNQPSKAGRNAWAEGMEGAAVRV